MPLGRLVYRVPIADTGLTITINVPQGGNGFWEAMNNPGMTHKNAWADILKIMQKYYAIAAETLQLMVVEAYKETVVRPEVSTHRLEGATLDERNRAIHPEGWQVGVPSFMDQSKAKYWRQIEEGTSIHVIKHQRLFGVWGSELTGGTATGSSGIYYLAGGEFHHHGFSSGGKFQPFKTWNGQVEEDGGGATLTGFIQKKIDAQDGYGRAFQRFKKTNRPINLLRAAVAEVMGLDRKKVPRSYAGIMGIL
jgi:hypothetical protein